MAKSDKKIRNVLVVVFMSLFITVFVLGNKQRKYESYIYDTYLNVGTIGVFHDLSPYSLLPHEILVSMRGEPLVNYISKEEGDEVFLLQEGEYIKILTSPNGDVGWQSLKVEAKHE